MSNFGLGSGMKLEGKSATYNHNKSPVDTNRDHYCGHCGIYVGLGDPDIEFEADNPEKRYHRRCIEENILEMQQDADSN